MNALRDHVMQEETVPTLPDPTSVVAVMGLSYVMEKTVLVCNSYSVIRWLGRL